MGPTVNSSLKPPVNCCPLLLPVNRRPFATNAYPLIRPWRIPMQDINWQALQNGSDIRGVALEGISGESVNLTPAIAERLGQAFVAWLSAQLGKSGASLRIAVGRDSRLSGPALLEAVTTAMAAGGAQVYDVGLASTPALFMSTVMPGFECDGAIMLTASHLPFNRNGLKFFTAHGGLAKGDISEILALAEGGIGGDTTADGAPVGTIEQRDLMVVYAAQLVDKIRAGVNAAASARPGEDPPTANPDQPLQGLKIIVDAGNGAGGFYASQVLEPLGADTTGSQFLEPDGMFPNHVPNPEDPAAMASICEAVVAQGADFGIIFDTDVDRSAAVDHRGQAINRNRLIALMSAIVLREHPGSTIVTDSITSDGLTEFIEALGGKHHRFRRGYKNVITEAMRLNDAGEPAWLAIETSGHGAMKENYFLDDGAYLVSKLLIELAQAQRLGQSITDLIASLQEPIASWEIRIKIQTDAFKTYGEQVIEQLEAFVAQQPDWAIAPQNHEGIRVTCTDPAEQGWFLLRLSLHDPVLPLNIESNIAGGADRITQRLRGFLDAIAHLDLSEFPQPELV